MPIAKLFQGDRFSHLSVIDYSHTNKGSAYWRCKCDCGNHVTVTGRNLRRGNTKSCGCTRHILKVRRPIRIDGDIAYIPLTHGYEAIIDATDVPLVEGRSWNTKPMKPGSSNMYASSFVHMDNGHKTTEVLHRLIMRDAIKLAEPGINVDHIDGNGLNCRQHNLRLASHSDNMRNRRCQANSKTGIKGVIYCPKNKTNPFYAHIRAGSERIFLGFYKTSEEAHEAYKAAAHKYHGKFARTA